MIDFIRAPVGKLLAVWQSKASLRHSNENIR